MKVCIITVYDSINCGSYLQAYVLGKICESLGCDVYYLKRSFKDKIQLKLSHLKKTLKLMIKKDFKAYYEKIELDKCFNKIQNNLKIITKKEMFKIDCIIIGSDTLWNINAKYFKKNYKLFFGGEFENKKCITYAVSSANAKVEKILKLPNIKSYVNKLYKISVRDNATKEVAEKLSDKNIELVCDPTLLFSISEYKNLIGKRKEEKKYIYLYLFDDLNKYQIENVKKFSKDMNLIIVDGNLNKSWADTSIQNTPDNFLNYMYYADYVITDTFHGTIFSINFNKQFVTINREKNKVNEFIFICDLKNRLSEKNTLSNILQEDINYKKVNQILDNYKEKSINYLKKALKNEVIK